MTVRSFNVLPAWGPSLKAIAIFLVIIGAGITYLLNPASRVVQAPLESFYAWAASGVLGLFFESAYRSGTTIALNGFAANIVPACTGLFTITIYVAAVLAFPASLAHKLKGLGFGVLSIMALNGIRIVTLMLIGAHWRGAFDFAHLVIWQSIAIFFAVFLWLFWVERMKRAS